MKKSMYFTKICVIMTYLMSPTVCGKGGKYDK